jgi:hypothetical protein
LGNSKPESQNKSKKEGVSWCTPVIPARGRLRQEDRKFKSSRDHISEMLS